MLGQASGIRAGSTHRVHRATRPVVRLATLEATRYRSLRSVTVRFGPRTVLIGTNAAGNSNVLDALRLLAEGVRERDFAEAVRTSDRIATGLVDALGI